MEYEFYFLHVLKLNKSALLDISTRLEDLDVIHPTIGPHCIITPLNSQGLLPHLEALAVT